MTQQYATKIALGLTIIGVFCLMILVARFASPSSQTTIESPREYYKQGVHYLIFEKNNSIFVVNYTQDSIELKIQQDYGDK